MPYGWPLLYSVQHRLRVSESLKLVFSRKIRRDGSHSHSHPHSSIHCLQPSGGARAVPSALLTSDFCYKRTPCPLLPYSDLVTPLTPATPSPSPFVSNSDSPPSHQQHQINPSRHCIVVVLFFRLYFFLSTLSTTRPEALPLPTASHYRPSQLACSLLLARSDSE